MPDAITILTGGHSIQAWPGETILSALRTAGKNIHSICGGRGMCGTCRVTIDDEWLNLLPVPATTETRLLRVLKAGAPNHRLACQLILDATHNGLRFTPDPPPTRIILKETTT